MNRFLLVAAWGLLAGWIVSCASPGSVTQIAPGERPGRDTDEGGLWMQMDRLEEGLRRSGHLLQDPTLNYYTADLVCRVAGPHCPDIRVYVLDNPYPNAAMAPNGAMQIWTGLLLRAQNEAQLAGVIGHEIAHYLERHSVQRWRDVKAKSSAVVFVGVLSAASGQWYVGDVATLVAAGSMLAFSRDQEREADAQGLEMVARAGYDVREVPKIWDLMIREQMASDRSAPAVFFSTHPSPQERLGSLELQAEAIRASSGAAVVGRSEYAAAVRGVRGSLLRNELRRRDFSGTTVLLDDLAQQQPEDGELLFYRGEMHRLRRQAEDLEKAIELYREAVERPNCPSEAHRSLGLALQSIGDRADARNAYLAYLELNPEAEDAAMVRAYLRQLE